jgi:hypothetical protein
MTITMTKTTLRQLENRIERIKDQLTRIGPMRPGSLTRQYKNPKEQSGAYYQLSYTLAMKSRTEYIQKDCLGEIRRQIKQYQRYKQLNAEWVSLSIEHSKLWMKRKHAP